MTRKKSITTITLCALFGLVLGGIFGCSIQDDNTYKVNGVTINEFEFQGCDYLKTPVSQGYSITHKGNCKNPIHKLNNPN
jgi:hypothetical protein